MTQANIIRPDAFARLLDTITLITDLIRTFDEDIMAQLIENLQMSVDDLRDDQRMWNGTITDEL